MAIGKYRWTICALVFFATTINYLDRQVISLLKSVLDKEFHWTKSNYADITMCFQLAYAIGMLGAGRLIDKMGTKIGYALSLIFWSIAAMGHGLIRTTGGFYLARAALGLTEAGNFPAAIKTITEWFPKKERSFATGIFNAGTNIGAIIAPLSVPFIAEAFGWRSAFVITGAIGLVWLIFWFVLYEIPAKHKKLSQAEFEYIHSDADEKPAADASSEKYSWARLFGYKQTWAFAMGKFFTDGPWWFYLFWLPDFLLEQYGLQGTDLALPVAVVYFIAALGSVFGGWLPLYLIGKGWPVFKARKTAMFMYAVLCAPVIAAQFLGEFNMWYAVLIVGLVTAAHQAWSANLYTIVSDMFPKKAIGSVIGIGGMAGALGSIFVSKSAGYLFDYLKPLGKIQTGYYFVFVFCGLAYLIAWLIIHFLVPKMKRANLQA